MNYFGGGGVTGRLHPSLQAYIDCFSSPPFPRMFPRGGGIWDQDPILMRDFRSIREFEIQWKDTQQQRSAPEGPGPSPHDGGQPMDLDAMLSEMLEEQGLEGDQFF